MLPISIAAYPSAISPRFPRHACRNASVSCRGTGPGGVESRVPGQDWGHITRCRHARSEPRPLGSYWGHLAQRLRLISHHFTRLQILGIGRKEEP